ncbi:MAG: ABC transporter substrate-binding protein [Candidatus Tectimicrobiota bacterium]|nr:MAG: ABC transporter substrate-binding protein [Candidatus Tectomicrobia bacterium]
MKRDRLVRAAGLVALLVLGMAVAPVWAAGGTLRFVPHADLKNIDPIWTTAYITRNHGYMIYDTLFALDADLQPRPQMVESWSVSPDGLTYTFTLRPGLKWHDGTPVRAADCVASIQRWGKRDGMGQKLMDATKELKVVDERTFTLTLKAPYGLVLHSLAKISSNVPFMMPERIAKTDPFTQISEPIGSGPFIFKKDEWVPGHKVVYVRNPDYLPRPEPPSLAAGGKVVKVDRVEWIYIPDQTTALNALMAGEVDYFEAPSLDLYPLLTKNPDITVIIADPLGSQGWLRPNHLHPPFNNKKARHALLWMVKQEDYMRAVAGDPKFWRTCGAYFVCGTPLESDVGSDPLMTQDLEKAKQLLKEAGYDGRPIVLMDPTDIPTLHNATLVTAQLLRKIGVNVDLQAMDWSTLTSRRAEKKPPEQGGWHLFHTSWIAPDVFNPVANIGVSGGCEERAWFGWPCDERLEKLRDAWARTSDPAEQKRLAEEIQRVAYDVVPYIITGQYFGIRAYRKNVKGVLQAPVPFLWNVSKE